MQAMTQSHPLQFRQKVKKVSDQKITLEGVSDQKKGSYWLKSFCNSLILLNSKSEKSHQRSDKFSFLKTKLKTHQRAKRQRPNQKSSSLTRQFQTPTQIQTSSKALTTIPLTHANPLSTSKNPLVLNLPVTVTKFSANKIPKHSFQSSLSCLSQNRKSRYSKSIRLCGHGGIAIQLNQVLVQ